MYTTYLVVLKISSDIYIHYTPCGSYDIYWYLNKHIILSLKHLLISTLTTLFHKLISTLKPLKYLHNTLWDICWYLHYNLWSINWYLHYTLWDICWYLHVTLCNIYKKPWDICWYLHCKLSKYQLISTQHNLIYLLISTLHTI